jgi:NADH-ubiquinone oxidoreductase B12 subunit family
MVVQVSVFYLTDNNFNRNEAWRYDPSFGTWKQRFNLTFFRGFKYGFGIFVAMAAIDTALSMGKSDHGHGHH